MVSTHPPGVQTSGRQYLPAETSTAANRSPNRTSTPECADNSNDCLEIGGCDVTSLVRQFGSPLYIWMRKPCEQLAAIINKRWCVIIQVFSGTLCLESLELFSCLCDR
jgi:hypothetical protein